MAKLAVDVVLLPPDAMTKQAIEINRSLLRPTNRPIVLDEENCLPHISLAMGCVDEIGLAQVTRILGEVACRVSPMDLRARGIGTVTTPSGKKISSIEVERTRELQELHEVITKRLTSYFTYDVAKNMLFSPHDVQEETFFWIQKYPHNSSFERFSPHITLGFGETDRILPTVRFTASTLALCHLGNFCTCRKTLFSVGLSGQKKESVKDT